MQEDVDDFWFNERYADAMFDSHRRGQHTDKPSDDCPWCNTRAT